MEERSLLERELENVTIVDGIVGLAALYAGYEIANATPPLVSAGVVLSGIGFRTLMNTSLGTLRSMRYDRENVRKNAGYGARYALVHSSGIAVLGGIAGAGAGLLSRL